MTKNVRIENADNSAYKVSVEVWEIRDGEHTIIEVKALNNPTDMLTFAIWKKRYLIVREQ